MLSKLYTCFPTHIYLFWVQLLKNRALKRFSGRCCLQFFHNRYFNKRLNILVQHSHNESVYKALLIQLCQIYKVVFSTSRVTTLSFSIPITIPSSNHLQYFQFFPLAWFLHTSLLIIRCINLTYYCEKNQLIITMFSIV